MYNKCLEYLLSNDSDDVMSKGGIEFRKFIHPVVIRVGKLLGPDKYVLIKREPERIKNPKTIEEIEYNKRPIIYAPTHGFKDDLLYSLYTAKNHAYILFGSLPQFFNTFDGFSAWANGVYLVDRDDRNSRKASYDKIRRGFELGVENLLWFPEGVWNKSPNLLILDLWNGMYRVALDHNALIVPISVMEEDGVCYAIQNKPIDVCSLDLNEGKQLIRDSLATAKWEVLEYIASIKGLAKRSNFYPGYWENYVNKLIDPVRKNYNFETEARAEYIDPTKVSEEEVFECLDNVELTSNNAYFLVRTRNDLHK